MPDRVNRWETYRAHDGWRVRLVAAENGETLLSGEAYVDRRDAQTLIDRVTQGRVVNQFVTVLEPTQHDELNDSVGVVDEDES